MSSEKQLLLDEVKDQIDQNGSFVIMRYFKLTANQANDLRGQVAKSGGCVEIARKRVLVKAAGAVGIPLEVADLPGHVGLVFAGDDPIETAKVVFKFGQDTKALEVIGGRFDGRLYSGADVETLSKLPGKDEMRAQLLSVLEAPMSQTLAVMEAVLTSVVYCLDNKCKQSSDNQQTDVKQEEVVL
jgi:large subunit ribosomal protein L10